MGILNILGDLKPKYQQYFQNPENEITKPELTLEGHHAELFYSTSSKCQVSNTDCQETMSLAMWMKNDITKLTTTSTGSSSRGNVHSYCIVYRSDTKTKNDISMI